MTPFTIRRTSSEGIARNQLLILREESYFEKNDGVHRCHYVEQLTSQLATKALDVFKTIEKGGGFLAQLRDGTIQREIKDSHLAEQYRYDSGEATLVGTNKYADGAPMPVGEFGIYPFVKTRKRKTIIEPIIPVRLAEKWEKKEIE